jgi:predicted ribosomally synthesized peptide with SipW-like signal peptide
MKKIILSSFMVLAVAAIAGYGTYSYFSDTETSTGNTFTAGSIDLKVDSTQHFNGNVCVANVTNPGFHWSGNAAYPISGTPCGGTWGQPDGKDIANEKFFDLADLKPGDNGENTISLHVDNNPAWACAKITITSDEDVTCTEPEIADDGSCTPSTTNAFNGEMAKNLSLAWWADANGDNVLDSGELNTLFFMSGAKLKNLLTAGGNANNHVLNLTLADKNTNFFLGLNNVGNTTPLAGGVTNHIGLAWCFGDMTISGTTISCNGAPLNNESQSDQLTADMSFSVEQARNNPDFACPDSFRRQ